MTSTTKTWTPIKRTYCFSRANGMTGCQRVQAENCGPLINCEQSDRSCLVSTFSDHLDRERGSTLITLSQATNMMGALAFAREVGTPLNAHATIHWVGTKIGDDPDGRRFAKVREGFDKWLRRHGFPDGLTAVWVRERPSGGSAEVVHCHMLFHLAHPFVRGRKRIDVEGALERLIDRHGGGNYADYTLKLTFPANPNGVYFLKGGGPEVWRMFAVPKVWRKPQGLVRGKRCGTTQNIGHAARSRNRGPSGASASKVRLDVQGTRSACGVKNR